jgi:hypothetical protein
MRMRPIHGAVVAVAIGGATAFGASAIKDTTHLGAAAQAKPAQNVDAIVEVRRHKLDAEEKALRKARRYRTPKLPAVPAAPGPVPSYSSYAVAQQPAAAPPTPTRPAQTRHVTLTRVVHRHAHSKPVHRVTRPSPDELTPTTTTTTTTSETTPTTTTVTTTTQGPVTTSTTSTVSSGDDEHGDDSHEQGQGGHDDGASGGGDS